MTHNFPPWFSLVVNPNMNPEIPRRFLRLSAAPNMDLGIHRRIPNPHNIPHLPGCVLAQNTPLPLLIYPLITYFPGTISAIISPVFDELD
jgi:hypothetical protein